MAGITVDTQVGTAAGQDEVRANRGMQPLKVVVLGDFSGRGSRGEDDPNSLGQRKLYRVDKDSFDEVFAALKVSVKLPIDDQPIHFDDIDQLHPDYLFENLHIFARYRQLLRQLDSRQHYQAAVQALTDEGIVAAKGADMAQSTPTTAGATGSLLDGILSTSTPQPAALDVAALIRQTVAPYVEPARDPRAEEYIAAVERAIGDVMRSLLHVGDFKSLEASWRSLDLLNRRADSDRQVHIHILDASKDELLGDWQGANSDLLRTQLGGRMLQEVGVPGAAPIDCLLLDAPLVATDDDVQVVQYLAQLARELGSQLLLGADAKLSRLYEEQAEEAPLQENPWRQLRQQAPAKHIYVAAPEYLLRLPFGERSNPIDGFAFEEVTQPKRLAEYPWGNSAYLLVLAKLQSRERAELEGRLDGTWARIGNLPVYVYRDEDGDECVMPATGTYLSAKRVAELEQIGLTVVQSVKNSDQVLVERMLPFKHSPA